MIRRPPRSTQSRSSAASDVYKRQPLDRPALLAIWPWSTAGLLRAILPARSLGQGAPDRCNTAEDSNVPRTCDDVDSGIRRGSVTLPSDAGTRRWSTYLRDVRSDD